MMISKCPNASPHDPRAARLEVLFEEVINRLALSSAGIARAYERGEGELRGQTWPTLVDSCHP